jgi:hypothetical protein
VTGVVDDAPERIGEHRRGLIEGDPYFWALIAAFRGSHSKVTAI